MARLCTSPGCDPVKPSPAGSGADIVDWGSQEVASVDGADDDDSGSLPSTLLSNPSSGTPLAPGLPPRRMKHSLSHLSGGRGSGLAQQGSGGRPLASSSDRRPSGVVGEFH